MNNRSQRLAALGAFCLCISGCGGGGGGSDNTVVGEVSPNGAISVPMGNKQQVTITFAPQGGGSASAFAITGGLTALPPGWSASASTFACSSVDGGNGCQLVLSFAPTGAERGSFSLTYQYLAGNAAEKSGSVAISYAGTTHDSVVTSVAPASPVATQVGAVQPLEIAFASSDGATVSGLQITSSLQSLPAGWSAPGVSAFGCPTLSASIPCTLKLQYAPQFADSGTFTLSYNFVDDSGAAGTGSLQIAYSAAVRALHLVAGSLGGAGNIDGLGTAARLNQPTAMAVDPAGDLYVADLSGVRRISPSGAVTTLPGSGGLGVVFGMTTDQYGNLFLTTQDATLRKITPAGVGTLLAGVPDIFEPFTAGPGLGNTFSAPVGVAVDAAGNVFVGDQGVPVQSGPFPLLGRIAKLTPDGMVSQFSPNFPFQSCLGMTLDGHGNLFVIDTANAGLAQIDQVSPAAIVTTLPAGAFGAASGIAVGADGYLYVSDLDSNSVSRVSTDGTVSLLAGGNSTPGYQDGVGANASFSLYGPFAGDGFGVLGDLTLGADGNLYIADTGNNTVRLVKQDGTTTTVVGKVVEQGWVDADGDLARFNFATIAAFPAIQGQGLSTQFAAADIAVDSAGNIYAADSANQVIRKITPNGTVTTLAGQVGTAGSADGMGAAAQFQDPTGIAVDAHGNIFVGDTGNFTIRKISPGGNVTTFAGTPGASGEDDGSLTPATFNSPAGLVVGPDGSVIVADTANDTIRRILPSGVTSTMAGSAAQAGSSDGLAAQARFRSPTAVAVTGGGTIYVADSANNTIRQINPDGTVSTLAGMAGVAGSADGAGQVARFSTPRGMARDPSGLIYVADTSNCTVRKIDSGGNVTTLAGAAGQCGAADGAGVAARFNQPIALTTDKNGNIYVADAGTGAQDGALREISPSGSVTTLLSGLAGPQAIAVDSSGRVFYFDSGSDVISSYSSTDQPGQLVEFALPAGGSPVGLAVDTAGALYATIGNAIYKMIPGNCTADGCGQPEITGSTVALAGIITKSGSYDGIGAPPLFSHPSHLAVDSDGNVYVADLVVATIRKITPAGIVSTLAGSINQRGASDGIGTQATFGSDAGTGLGIAVDGQKNVYVADTLNQTIRKIAPNGQVSTLAGTPGFVGSDDGLGRLARFNNPVSLSSDAAGNIVVADQGNHEIRMISPSGTVTTVVGQSGLVGTALTALPASLGNLWAVASLRGGELAIAADQAILSTGQ